jgi:hypothetical protein
MEPEKPLVIVVNDKMTIGEKEKVGIIVAEAGPIGGSKETFTFTTTTSSADIVTTVTKPYEAILEYEIKELIIETVERSKKHFVEGLKFSFSPKDWTFSFELRREPEKIATTKMTAKKESKG